MVSDIYQEGPDVQPDHGSVQRLLNIVKLFNSWMLCCKALPQFPIQLLNEIKVDNMFTVTFWHLVQV